MTSMERRRTPRMLCADLVEVGWKDEAGRQYRSVANLEDISLAGACVQMDRAMPVGTRLSLRTAGVDLQAAVQYCIYRDQSYFVGMEFKDSSRWSPEEFLPEHMLDPRELTVRALKRE